MTKIAFITGASSGFGRACAEKFAKHGWGLVITGRRSERLVKLKRQLTDVPVHVAPFDVRDRGSVDRAVAELPERFRQVEVLVNNAGLALGFERAPECSLEDWQTMIDTNIKGLLYCTKALLPGMIERNTGHIVNIGSVAGSYCYPGGNVYGATKAFVKQFSLNLKTDLVGTDIRVTDIEPGIAETEFSIVRFKGDTGKAAEFYKNCRPLTGEDVAEAVYWAVSLPAHVNINRIEMMPVCQGVGPWAIHRDKPQE